MTKPEDIPQVAVDAFKKAWAAKGVEVGRGIPTPGEKTRAGLAAVYEAIGIDKILEGVREPNWDGYGVNRDMDEGLTRLLATHTDAPKGAYETRWCPLQMYHSEHLWSPDGRFFSCPGVHMHLTV